MYFDPVRGGALRNVILVAGHAILKNFRDPMAEDDWVLLPFQKGEAPCYVGHVRRGVELAAADPAALLIFCGGQSRREAGPRSEAQSYFWIADHYGWFDAPQVAARATTEEFSRDSYENLLLGICRFRECLGRYPEQVRFVSWKFKRERFELHREAIRWPRERFEYVGANDPPQIAQAIEAERQTMAAYAADPYSGTLEFRAKRDARNPFARRHGYAHTSPELTPLFDHAGPEPFPGRLPWE